MSKPENSHRIVVVGTSGAGKTTFAKKVAEAFGIPHFEMDSLHWEPNWVEASFEVFQDRVERATASPSWVIEGNYGKVRDSTWGKAGTLVWLDYPFHIVFGRALFRTIKRAITREHLWNGNRESFRKSFFSKESILVWVLQTYKLRKREFLELISSPKYAHLKIIRFQSPREANAYLTNLESRRRFS